MQSSEPSNILVVAPHPDDETLGCGGTLLKHKSKGHRVTWLIITDAQVKDGWSTEFVDKRQKQITAVKAAYNFDQTYNLSLAPTKLDQISTLDLVKAIGKVIEEVKPSEIYLPFQNDVHSDHRIVFNAAYSLTKNFRHNCIKQINVYEALSETEFSPALGNQSFIPNYFVDITSFFEKKLEIMALYESEVMAPHLPRSIETITAQGRYRGSRIGKKYAESFMLIYKEN